MNLLANENFPLLSVRLLRTAGHDVASVIEDTPGASDEDVLKRASQEKRVMLTFDRDYGELLYRYKSFPPSGILYFRFVPSAAEEPAQILLTIMEEGKVVIPGKFTVIERGRIRQRALLET